MEKIISSPNILIWDEDNLVYYEGHCGSFDLIPNMIEYRTIDDGSVIRLQGRDTNFSCSISNLEEKNNVDLDPTLMKRISKYNKEVEITKLDNIIKEKEKHIKELDNILNDKYKRVDKLKQYIAKIWDIDVKEDDDDEYWD